MFFKLFTLSTNTEKDIGKAGFLVNSYDEVNIYNGDKLEFTNQTPKDYLLNGELWKKIDSIEIYERSCLLVKTPYLSFDELWDLLLNADQEDDRIGALVLMHKQHYSQLRQKYIALVENDNISKIERRALKLLSSLM